MKQAWTELARLEPALATIEEEIRSGDLSLSAVMTYGRLGPLVGRAAKHPRLRTSDAVRVAYGHLMAIDEEARAARKQRGRKKEEGTCRHASRRRAPGRARSTLAPHSPRG